MSRINTDKILDNVTGEVGDSMLYIVADILAKNMTMNNYIRHINYKKLSDMLHGLYSYDRLRHNKPLEYLVRQNIISINDDKQLMVNPRIAFACKYTEENMEALDKMYQHFRTTGEFTPYFKSS